MQFSKFSAHSTLLIGGLGNILGIMSPIINSGHSQQYSHIQHKIPSFHCMSPDLFLLKTSREKMSV